jgi:hypothetical protein
MSSYNPTTSVRNLGPHVECFDIKVKDYIKLGGQMSTPTNTNAGDHTAVMYVNPSDILSVKMNNNVEQHIVHTGAGSIQQATSNTTTVTLNKRAGQVYMFTTVPANTAQNFALNNTFVDANKFILCWISNTVSATSKITPSAMVNTVGVGSCTFTITNNDAANATAAAPIVNFIVL